MSGSSELTIQSAFYQVTAKSASIRFPDQRAERSEARRCREPVASGLPVDQESEREWHRRWREETGAKLKRLQKLLDAGLPAAGEGWTLAKLDEGGRRYNFHPPMSIKGIVTMSVAFGEPPSKAGRSAFQETVATLLKKLR